MKSVKYEKSVLEEDENYNIWLNFAAEKVSIANFITPGVVTDDDLTMIVTMSKFAEGYKAQQLPPMAPWTWIYDEDAVRTMGKWWGDFRTQNIKFKEEYPLNYDLFPKWDTTSDGW